MDFDDINLEKSYNPLKSYTQSKLANILFTKELVRRLNSNIIKRDIFYNSIIYEIVYEKMNDRVKEKIKHEGTN